MTTGRDLDSQVKALEAKLAEKKAKQTARDLRKTDEWFRALDRAHKALSRLGSDKSNTVGDPVLLAKAQDHIALEMKVCVALEDPYDVPLFDEVKP